ncbi:thiamine pyrophosphokinase [Dipodascopsis uninucleata]
MPLTESDISTATRIDYSSFLLEDYSAKGKEPYALVILNQPIGELEVFKRVWRNASIRVCADGGANRLYESLEESERSQFKPDFVAGDLDSLKLNVRKFYEHELGAPIYKYEDQDSTDFGKCLSKITDLYLNQNFHIVAYGATGGRVDQSFHSIHTLFYYELCNDSPWKITLLSDDSLSFLIKPGTQRILTPRTVLGPTCGIIPIAGPSVISTSGLEWDIQDWKTSFGHQVSTSNHLENDEIIIKCDLPMLFTVEVKPYPFNESP